MSGYVGNKTFTEYSKYFFEAIIESTKLKKFIEKCPLHLIILLLFYTTFIFAGAAIISCLEDTQDNVDIAAMKGAYRLLLKVSYPNVTEDFIRFSFRRLFNRLSNGASVEVLWSNRTKDNIDVNWRIDQSLLYAVSVVTVIGYGNVAPKTKFGKAFTIIFAMFGVPLTYLMVSLVANELVIRISKARSSLAAIFFRDAVTDTCWLMYLSFFATSICFFFILFPSYIVFIVERDWSFVDSLYFCFTSLATIGLGDLVPAQKLEQTHKEIYTVCVCFYLLTGIAFILAFFREVKASPYYARLFNYFDSCFNKEFENNDTNNESNDSDENKIHISEEKKHLEKCS